MSEIICIDDISRFFIILNNTIYEPDDKYFSNFASSSHEVGVLQPRF